MHSRGVNSGQRLRFHFFIYKNLISFASWIGVFCTIVDDESEILLGGSGSVDLSPFSSTRSCLRLAVLADRPLPMVKG